MNVKECATFGILVALWALVGHGFLSGMFGFALWLAGGIAFLLIGIAASNYEKRVSDGD